MPGVFVNRDEGSKGKGGLGSLQSHARVPAVNACVDRELKRGY